MSEIKQPNTTNSDAVWEHILSYQRFVVQTGAVNLLVSLVKKVHGLPVHPYIPSAVASQIASEIDTKRLKAAGLGDVQILLVRKLPKLIEGRNQGHYNAFELHHFANALQILACYEEYYAGLITRLDPMVQIVWGKGIQELAEKQPQELWADAVDGLA